MYDQRMRIAICDVNTDSLNEMAEMSAAVAAEEGIPCEISCYSGGEKLLAAAGNGAAYDVLLLDTGHDGMELAAALREMQREEPIVLVSDRTDWAPRGYEVRAARYLLRPLEKDKVREALRFCCRHDRAGQAVLLPTACGLRRFRFGDIVYAETWGRELRMRLSDGQLEHLLMRLSDLQAMLPSRRFILCHRTILVNLDYVLYLRYCELELKTGETLPVSKYRLNTVREGLLADRRE